MGSMCCSAWAEEKPTVEVVPDGHLGGPAGTAGAGSLLGRSLVNKGELDDAVFKGVGSRRRRSQRVDSSPASSQSGRKTHTSSSSRTPSFGGSAHKRTRSVGKKRDPKQDSEFAFPSALRKVNDAAGVEHPSPIAEAIGARFSEDDGDDAVEGLDPDSPPARALQAAERMMAEHRLLDAERALVEAMLRIEDSGDQQVLDYFTQSLIFRNVVERVALYEEIGDSLQKVKSRSGTMEVVWEEEDAKLWCYMPPEGTWFQTQLAVSFEAPLHQVVAITFEHDLARKWMPMLAEEPEALVPKNRSYGVMRQVFSVLMFKTEAVFENLRVINGDFGSLVEMMRSDFPAEEEGIELPERSWLTPRVDMNANNVWIPRGGGRPGTVFVQQACVDPGLAIPDTLRRYVVDTAAQQAVTNFRNAVALMKDKGGSPWRDRVRSDSTGIYRELKSLERVAASRAEVTVHNLPGAEIVKRKHLPRDLTYFQYEATNAPAPKPRDTTSRVAACSTIEEDDLTPGSRNDGPLMGDAPWF